MALFMGGTSMHTQVQMNAGPPWLTGIISITGIARTKASAVKSQCPASQQNTTTSWLFTP